MSGLQRWMPATGVLFAVLFVIGAGLWETPETDSPASEWIAYYEDSDNRVMQIVSGYLLSLSAFALLVFIWDLLPRVAGSGDRGSRLPSLAMPSTVLVAGTLLVAAIGAAGLAGSVELGDAPLPSVEVMIQLEALTAGLLLVGGGLGASLLVAAISVAAQRERTLPMWLVWVGYAAAVILLASPLFIPFFALPLWTLIVGGYLVLQRG